MHRRRSRGGLAGDDRISRELTATLSDRRWIYPAVLGSLLVAGIVIVRYRHDAAMTDVATAGRPLPSPSGRHRVLVIDTTDEAGFPAQTFEIQTAAGERVFAAETRWSTRHRLAFAWDAQDRLWVYSSDVGTDVWEDVGGRWTQRAWVRGGGLQPPDVIRRLAPAIFR